MEHEPRRRLPVFERVSDPPPMRFEPRDGRIIEAIAQFEGVLADYQIGRLFFPDTGERTVRDRLSLLFQHGYLARPGRTQRAQLPCMVYRLDRQGWEYLAGLTGEALPPAARAKPHWSLVPHTLAVNDVRIAVLESCQRHPEIVLEEWISSAEFWAHPDAVTYEDTRGRRVTRRVRPDGYFVLFVAARRRHRMLLEVDRATEDNPRFAREKVLPGIAYIKSEVYAQRFGANAGRWLVVTTSERRMKNMIRQTAQAAGKFAHVFSFTTFGQVASTDVLTAPIWWRPGRDEPGVLLGEDSPQ